MPAGVGTWTSASSAVYWCGRVSSAPWGIFAARKTTAEQDRVESEKRHVALDHASKGFFVAGLIAAKWVCAVPEIWLQPPSLVGMWNTAAITIR